MDLAIIIKLVLAAALGGVVGIEREMRRKPAGLRTHMLICVGSALFVIVSTRAAEVFGGDPMRIAAQIIAGIGFLGAGAILHSRGSVLGLTTAATIWMVAGVGMAIGAGLYAIGVFATVLSIVTLCLFWLVENKLQPRRQSYIYTLGISGLSSALAAINNVLEPLGITPEVISFKKETQGYRVRFTVTASRELNEKISQAFLDIKEILELEQEEGTPWSVP